MKGCNYKPVCDYIEMIDTDYMPVNKEIKQLSAMIKRVFEEEELFLDTEQAEKYFKFERYFPFSLFEWEKFAFTLHNCLYRADGFLRFPTLWLLCGRGTGKNGFLSFEDFSLLTPVNGIKDYHIDTFAMSEDQAKTTFDELYAVLNGNPKYFKNYFYWNKEKITNLKTGSTYRYRTSNFKTKDSGRPGKVDFDEIHAYENDKLISVGTSGLGKKAHPRRTFLSTDGYVRGATLDEYKSNAADILSGLIGDNGTLPMWYRLDSDDEVHDERNWVKAVPSLPYMPTLLNQMRMEYEDYKNDPIRNLDFMTKRMNRPQEQKEECVASNECILQTKQDLLSIKSKKAILCFDYASRRDWAAAGVITRQDDKVQFNCKLFILKGNPDLPRIKAPLEQWTKMGLVEWVDGQDIPPEKLIDWAEETRKENDLEYTACALDYYRYSILKKQLDLLGFYSGKDGNLFLIRPSDIMRAVPVICSALDNGKVICGDNPPFRWCARNTKRTIGDKRGNEIFEKIEPKSRKTDLFMCFVAGMCVIDMLPEYEDDGELLDVIIC